MERSSSRTRAADPQLAREAAIGRLSRLLAKIPVEFLQGYEQGLDNGLREGDVHHPRIGVVKTPRCERDADAMRCRILSKASLMTDVIIGSYVDLVATEYGARSRG
jgi:hypothetical protein